MWTCYEVLPAYIRRLLLCVPVFATACSGSLQFQFVKNRRLAELHVGLVPEHFPESGVAGRNSQQHRHRSDRNRDFHGCGDTGCICAVEETMAFPDELSLLVAADSG